MNYLFVPVILTLLCGNVIIKPFDARCDYSKAAKVVHFFTNGDDRLDLGSFVYRELVDEKVYAEVCKRTRYKLYWGEPLSSWIDENKGGIPKYLMLPAIETMVCYK